MVRYRYGGLVNFLPLLHLILCVGCATAPVTGRSQLILIPESTEIGLGLQSYREILGKSKLSQDQQVVAMVRKMGNRIASAANKPEYEWEFNVIHVGLILMAKAGYDPPKAPDFWKRMAAKKGKKSPPEFLSTHPADKRRIEQIKQWFPEAMEYYRPASHLR